MAATECIVQRTAGYTVMSNHHLRDKRLSLKAKGLLSVILSLPEDWDYTIAGLAAITDTGKDAISAALKELEKAGYINRSRIRTEGGQLGGTKYIIREIPADVSQPMAGFPAQAEPAQEEPAQGNPPQLNTKGLITDQSNPPISPEADEPPKEPKGRKKGKEKAEAKADDFDRFWSAYPLKVGKKKARDAFAKVKVPVETLLAALEVQKKSAQWVKDGGAYIPHPTTWLNGERWEDEAAVGAAPGPAPSVHLGAEL